MNKTIAQSLLNSASVLEAALQDRIVYERYRLASANSGNDLDKCRVYLEEYKKHIANVPEMLSVKEYSKYLLKTRILHECARQLVNLMETCNIPYEHRNRISLAYKSIDTSYKKLLSSTNK